VQEGNLFLELIEGTTCKSTVPPLISSSKLWHDDEIGDASLIEGFKKAAYIATVAIAPTTILLNLFL